MKSIVSILTFVFLANLTIAQNYLGDNKLVLDGEAKLIVESDRASFTYKVIGYGPSLREAVTVAKAKIKATVSILSKYSVKKTTSVHHCFKVVKTEGEVPFCLQAKTI